MNNHFLPSDFHFYAKPDIYNKVWISPCPCGLVSINNLPGTYAKCAKLSIIAGTFSYLIRVTYSLFRPKYKLFSNNYNVNLWVSSDVMIANGNYLFPCFLYKFSIN